LTIVTKRDDGTSSPISKWNPTSDPAQEFETLNMNDTRTCEASRRR